MAVLTEVLKTSNSVEARRNAVWALTPIERTEARAAVRLALSDGDERVRQVAIHSASVWRDAGSLPQLLDLLRSSAPALQRASAEALGRIGDKTAVPELLAATGGQHDRVLDHSLTYALIEIADPKGTAALIALDQMDGGELKSEKVTPLLASSDPLLKQTASWIISHHPKWGGALAGFFRQRLDAKNLSPADRDGLQQQLSQFGGDKAIQALLAATVEAGLPESRLTGLRSMAQTPLKEIPANWSAALARALAGNDHDLVRQAVSTARALPKPKEGDPKLSAALLRVGRDRSSPNEVRLEALAAIPEGLANLEPELFELLCASIDPSQPVSVRGSAASVLAKAKLTSDQLLSLTDAIRSAGPLELSTLLVAFGNAGDETLGLKLMAAVKQSKGLLSLRPDVLKASLAKFPDSVQKEGDKVLASLDIDPAKQKTHLDQLLVSLKGGDIRRGQAIFNSTKAACSACHAIGYLGGKVGPDLTSISTIRSERDLLESIIYPSASFVRSYEPVVVVTQSGDVHNGVIRRDAPDGLLLATGPRTEVRIARADIKEMRPSNVSVMPAGLEDQLTRQELADLLAFLKNTRWGAQ